jgi:hypothetical protein
LDPFALYSLELVRDLLLFNSSDVLFKLFLDDLKVTNDVFFVGIADGRTRNVKEPLSTFAGNEGGAFEEALFGRELSETLVKLLKLEPCKHVSVGSLQSATLGDACLTDGISEQLVEERGRRFCQIL